MGGEIDEGGKIPAGERRRRVGLWVFAAAIPLGIFVYLSIRPVMHLRGEPLPEFHISRPGWNAKQRAAEDRLARAYWTRAVQLIQWQHAYGTALPDNPPPEFRIDEKDFQRDGLDVDFGTREAYWRKLREAWELPETWEKSYEWHPSWVRTSLIAFVVRAGQFVDDLLSKLRY